MAVLPSISLDIARYLIEKFSVYPVSRERERRDEREPAQRPQRRALARRDGEAHRPRADRVEAEEDGRGADGPARALVGVELLADLPVAVVGERRVLAGAEDERRAAIEGASARVWGNLGGWRPFLRVITTPELWVARVKPGRVIFEIDGVNVQTAKEALSLAAAKLPIKTRFVARIAE